MFSASPLSKDIRPIKKDKFTQLLQSDAQAPYTPDEFTIKTKNPNRSEYYLLRFTDPYRPSQRGIIGLDAEDVTGFGPAMEKARDTGLISHIGLHKTPSTGQTTFSLLLPLYDQTQPHETLEDRRKAFVGLIDGVILSNDLFDSIMNTNSFPNISFQVYSSATPDLEQLLYSNTLDVPNNTSHSTTAPITLRDATWSIVATDI